MSNIYLTLSGVAFQDFEVPEKISFGGRQRVAVHELIGGGRVVDTLGAQPAEIKFSGIASGTDATARIQSLDTACAAGSVLPLGWDAFFYNVVIAEFAADYTKPYWIPFEIGCVVIADAAISNLAVPAVAENLISGDLSSATVWASQAGLGGFSFTSAGAVAAQAACGAVISAAGGGVLSSVVVVNNPSTIFAAVDALNGLGADAATLAAATYASGYLKRAVQNISLGEL
jgi:hypothetical protein